MQGHRNAIGSLSENLDFNHGSTPGISTIEQEICWDNRHGPTEHELPNYMLPPHDPSITYINSVGDNAQSLNGWNLGESSSRNSQNEVLHDERKVEHEWSSSVSVCAGVDPRVEERHNGCNAVYVRRNDNANANSNHNANVPLFPESSRTDITSQDLDLNATFGSCGGDDCQVVQCPDNMRITSASTSSLSDSQSAPGSDGYLVEQNDGRVGCSLEGRRLSCKRKALDGNSGQSSTSGSSRNYQCAESNVWHALPSRCNAVISSSTISAPLDNIFNRSSAERINLRGRSGPRGLHSERFPDLGMAGHAENSRRNLRVRIGSSYQQDPVPPNLFPAVSSGRHSTASSSRQSSILLPVNNSSVPTAVAVPDNMHSSSQPVVFHVPALPQSVQSVGWSGTSSLISGSSSSFVASGERVDAVHDATNARRLPRNILEHSMFAQSSEMRNLTPNPANSSLTGVSASITGNVASPSWNVPISGISSSNAPSWAPQHSSSQYPRRLSEYVRQSLFSVSPDAASPSNTYSSLSPSPTTSQPVAHSSGANNSGLEQPNPRSVSWMERPGGSVLGFPYSFRTWAAASDGRSRLVSEIRNVLDLMRRGEGVRFEDFMILDQSLLFGVADIHDRHRDLRLDVDNMSYEELLALEERIGSVSTGLSEESILSSLKQHKYINISLIAETISEPCCICQEEYMEGEDLGKLECGHEFHRDCIKKWLTVKNLCPVCKTTALPTCSG